MCGTLTTCNRDDEIAYDPDDSIAVGATDLPNSIPPYLTFVSGVAPYKVLGQENFAAQGLTTGAGLEQPAYDHELHVFLQTLPTTNADGAGVIALTDPKTFKVTKVINLDAFHCSPSGEAVGPAGHIVVACAIPGAAAGTPSSFPLVLDLNTGDEVGPGITQVGGGDEVNYDPGDKVFIVAANVDGVSTYPQILGVIDAETGIWLQNLPSSTLPPSPTVTPDGTGGLATTGRTGNLAALGENDHVFVKVTAATAAGASDICGTFGGAATGTTAYSYTPLVDQGCIAVFSPTDEEHGEDRDHNGDAHSGH